MNAPTLGEVQVTLERPTVVNGEQVTIQIKHERICEFSQIQVDVFSTCELNPNLKISTSTDPVPNDESIATISFDTVGLAAGIYEARRIVFHKPIAEEPDEMIGFLSGQDFERALFEVVEPKTSTRTAQEIRAEVDDREADIEARFSAPVDISIGNQSEKIEAAVLVFIRNVLIGTPTRFDHFEILPTGRGLDSQDELNFVNAYIKERTTLGIAFEYSENLKLSSRTLRPVCVAHFPNIHASSLEEARDYCRQKTESLLLAYSLIRDAAGEVFEIVVVDRKSGQSTKYSVSGSYTGNLLTGQLAGESSETMQTLIKGMAADPLSEFLVNLYKQGRQERNPDFQYLRFWQILEILAASKNYDEDADLLDYQGQEMMDGSNIRKCRGHVHTVFALFRDEGMGSSIETWRNVNIWYAFRSAVAHYGGVARFGALSHANVRVWAERGFDEISNAGSDKYHWQLKEDVKMLLKRRLVRMG